MATYLSQNRLQEIERMLQSGRVKLPESGTIALPDSPGTGLSSTGKLIEISTGQELGSLTPSGAPTPSGQLYSGTITGDLLNPVTGIPYTNPTSVPASPVTVPTPKTNELSVPQQQESDLNKQLQQLNDIIAGKSAYETQQREIFGVGAKEATKQSLINQLSQLKAFTENIPQQLQAESVARGRTGGGIAPIEAGRLRNAGIQANILNANYATASGDLALAESHVQQAVHDKFAPYEAKHDKLLENLELIKKSPEATIAEKNRIAQTEAKIKAQDAEKEAVKSVFNDIIKLSTSVSGSATHDANTSLAMKQINDLANSINYDDTTGKTLTTRQEAVNLLTKAQQLAQPYTAKQPTGQSDFEQAFQRTYGRLPNLQELQNYEKNKSAGATGNYVPGTNPTVDNWAKLIISGQANITQVPNPKGSTLRSDVINAITQSGQLLLSDKDREKLSTLDTAFNVYNTIKDLSEKINTFDVVGRVTGYLSRYLGGKTQFNTDIARYRATREGFVSNVARTLGEKGTLAEGDVQRAINNLPTINDTQAVARGKLETLKNILEGAKTSIIQKSTEPFLKTTSGTLGIGNTQTSTIGSQYKSPSGKSYTLPY